MADGVIAAVALIGSALAGGVIGFILGVIAGQPPSSEDRSR